MTSCIHFIRHGITEGIINKWYYGEADIPLIEEGIKELNELKLQGVYPSLDNSSDCYTSGMLRANQTFEVIFGDRKYTEITNLREMNFGSWECKTFDELKTLDGFDEWINDKTGSFSFPGGDSPVSFFERVTKGFDEVMLLHNKKENAARKSGGNAVSTIVCHGGVIAACMCKLLDKPMDSFWQLIPPPGRGYTVHLENGKLTKYVDI